MERWKKELGSSDKLNSEQPIPFANRSLSNQRLRGSFDRAKLGGVRLASAGPLPTIWGTREWVNGVAG